MEKVKLSNGAILEFKEIRDNGNLSITFENQNYIDLRILFDSEVNLSSIEVLTEGDAVCAIYNGYTKTDKYIIQGENVTVYLIKPDDTQQQIDALKKQNQYLQETVDTLILESLEG